MKSHLLALALSMLCILTGCKNDKPDPNEFNDEGVPFDENTTDRQYLEDTATEILGYIHPQDQEATMRALNGFIKKCETYDFPDNFYDDVYSSRALYEALEHNDLLMLSRAVTNVVYNMSRFKGLYQANEKTETWQFTEARDDVNFRYWLNGREYNLMIVGDGSAWSASTQDDGVSYTVEVPKTIKMVLYSGSIMANDQLMYALIKTDGRDNDHLNIDAEIKVANLYVESNTNATNTRMSENVKLYLDNTTTMVRSLIMSATTELQGSGICSIDSWRRVFETGDVSKVISGGNSTAMFVQRVQIKSQLTDASALSSCLDEIWEGASAQAQAANAARSLSSALKAQVYYAGNTNKVRANMGWEAYLYDEWGSYEAWSVRPTITFASDGATFDFESYFGDGRFLSIEKSYNSLMKAYMSFLR